MIDLSLSRFWAFILAFIIGAILLPWFINYMKQMRMGQAVREDGPQSHLLKEGTPTMGGVIILFSIVIASLVLLIQLQPAGPVGWSSGTLMMAPALLLATFMAFGLLGFADDYLKATRGQSLGLNHWQKLLWQFLIAIAFLALLNYLNPNFDTSVSAFGRTLFLGWLFWPMAAILIVGMSNAVNITDGMDGLVAGLATIAAVALMTASFTIVNAHIAIVLAATAGACLAFLWFNANPARVFMGDTGSLALGGLLAAAAILTGQIIPLLIIGFVFVLEAGTVAAQVGYFKFSRRVYDEGRRIWKMAPLHHHFELSGWPEQKVVVRFWIIGLLFAILGILSRGDWHVWTRF